MLGICDRMSYRFEEMKEGGSVHYCCSNCFKDRYLKKYVEVNSEELGDCDYCGAEDIEIISTQSMGFHLCECIEKAYEDVDAGTGAMYDSETKGYIGPSGDTPTVYSIREILVEEETAIDIDQLSDDKIGELISDLFGELYTPREIQKGAIDIYSDVDSGHWVLKDDLYGEEINRAYISWNYFKHVSNHFTRFFEVECVKSRKACLDSLLPYIYDLITDISSGAEFYRIREQSSELQDFDHIDVIKQMGPPPAVRAKTNRMNPAGIPYLYLASDIDTAIKECRLSPSKKALCAKYRTKDNLLQILDLSRMDYFTAGSIFSGEYSHDDRWANQFLRGFEREISAPVSSNITDPSFEYAATQVVAEYFRIERHLDGICYNSSVGGGKSYVFFLGPDYEISSSVYPYPFGDPYYPYELPVLDPFTDEFEITQLSLIEIQGDEYFVLQQRDV